jgi:hypothetical protein
LCLGGLKGSDSLGSVRLGSLGGTGQSLSLLQSLDFGGFGSLCGLSGL